MGRLDLTASSSEQQPVTDSQPDYQDIYAHPAAVAYAAAHPLRQIPQLSPYLLLLTLGTLLPFRLSNA
jgi:protein-serine/threonine kinase